MPPAIDMGAATTSVTTHDDAIRNVLVLYEAGCCGAAALAEGAALVAGSTAVLTVVALAPQDSRPGCTVYAAAYNVAVRDQASADLGEADRLLTARGVTARYELLVEGRDTPFEQWVARRAFDVVLLPARRGPFGRRRSLVRRLRRSPGCEVRLCRDP